MTQTDTKGSCRKDCFCRILNDNGELSHRKLGFIWKKESISYK
jgi:hypothetical protein